MAHIVTFLQNHPLAVLVAWQAISGALSAIYRSRTPEQIAAFKKSFPALVALLALTEALGFDLPKVLTIVQRVLAGNAASAASLNPPPPEDGK